MSAIDSSSGSSDEEYPRYKWMPVDLPKNFDPTKVPSSGEEYLHMVMYEARNCQTVTKGNIDFKKFAKNQTLCIDDETPTKVEKSFKPTLEWQNQQVKEFTHFRKYIHFGMPKLSDVDCCRHHHWIDQMNKVDPKMSDVAKFNSHAKAVLLELIVSELDKVSPGETIGDRMSCWIYFFLSLLEIPLYPNTYCVLRELARKCANIRSNLSKDSSPTGYKHLNLFICLVAKYFGQHDLADN